MVVDAVPQSLKQFAIDLFGTADKIALLVGTAVLLGGFAALLGVLAVRRLTIGLAGIAAFAVLGVAAALTRPGADLADALPSLVGGGLGALVLWLFIAGPLELDPGPGARPPRRPRPRLRASGSTRRPGGAFSAAPGCCSARPRWPGSAGTGWPGDAGCPPPGTRSGCRRRPTPRRPCPLAWTSR
ncbi:hypothetical protein GCM10027614_58880 [Micromonospora vulcania]